MRTAISLLMVVLALSTFSCASGKKAQAPAYLGDADTNTTNSSLRRTSEAMEQGQHRFDRGHFFYKKCREMADLLNLELNWNLKIAPGVGHSNSRMAVFAEKVLFE